MNQKLQAELTTWLQSIRENAEGAKGFVLEQAPDVVREFVTLGRIETTTLVVLGALALIAGAMFFRWEWKNRKMLTELHEDPGITLVIANIAAVVLYTACLSWLIQTLHTLICVWFAPRVYIIETAARLLGAVHGN